MREKYRHPEPSTQNLVAHYKLWAGLTGATTVFNYGSLGVSATLAGTNIAAVYPGIKFNGTDDYIDMGQDFKTTFQNSFGINAWCQLADGNPAGYTPIIGNYEGLTGNFETWIEVSDIGKVFCGIKTSHVNLITVTEDTASFTNGVQSWKMITWVCNKLSATTGNALIYVNGVLTKTSATQDFTWADYNPPNSLWLGKGVTGYLDGSLGEVSIFNAAKTAPEIKSIYELTCWRYL